MPSFRLPLFWFEVAAEPLPLTREQQNQKQYQLAQFYSVCGDRIAAKKALDQLLAADPTFVGGYQLRARLLVTGGDLTGAVTEISKGIKVHKEKFPEADPPEGLLLERKRMMDRLMPELVMTPPSNAPGLGPLPDGATNMKRFCTHCGVPVRPGAKFCTACGEKL